MKKISDEIRDGKLLVSDGAWGTLLMEKGLKPGDCPEYMCLTNRQIVFEIAKGYVDAGSDLISTNSFGANRFKLLHYGLEKRVSEINKAAASISREAAGNSRHVLGSIGPTGKILLMGDVTEVELYDAFAEQASALEKGGADAALVETMSAIDEAFLAVKAVKENTNLEIICTFAFERTPKGEYRTMMGITPSDMAVTLINAGADIIGANCGTGIRNMAGIVKEFRSVSGEIPIMIQANTGKPHFKGDRTIFPETSEYMASIVPELISAGANIIGGCCGTSPKHIRKIAGVIKRPTAPE
ncbi:MAG: homocysteine S-methyltransferase family protein [bacterium]